MRIDIEPEYYNPLQVCLSGGAAPWSHWKELMASATDYMDSYMLRLQYVKHIGYSICTEETIHTLATYLNNKKVLDLGSGSGYLASQLSKKGVNVIAIDNSSTHTFEQQFQRDITADVISSLSTDTHTYSDIILSWPPYESEFAHKIFERLKPGTTIWYLGESCGGCCADDHFFEDLDQQALYLDIPSKKLNEHHLQFQGIHDYWQVYKKI